MVRKYKPRTQRIKIDEKTIKEAVSKVRDQVLSLHKAAEVYGVKYPTLRRYYVKFIADSSQQLTPTHSNVKVFSEAQETELANYLLTLSKSCYGISGAKLRVLAYELAMKLEISVPPSWFQNCRAGIDWYQSFMKRNASLSMRTPLNRSISRAVSFNEHTAKLFFDNLQDILARFPKLADGTRIFNLDETSTTTVPSKPTRVIAEKGAKEVSQMVSAERGVLVTTCCIIAANGSFIPPAMVFPRKNFKPWMLKGAPPGTLGLANPSGWMTKEKFCEVMRHFVEKTSASKANPALLILDNAEIHFSIECIDIAKENGVIMLTLPPHSSHKLQPLDKAVFSSFKRFYSEALNNKMMSSPGHPLTIYEVAECVGYAFDRSFTAKNIRSGFSATGIFPFDRNIFSEEDFMPAQVTALATAETHKTPSGSSSNTSNSSEPLTQSSNTPGSATMSVNTSGSVTPASNTSSANVSSCLHEILPLPKAKRPCKETNRKPRKLGRSFIPTDTLRHFEPKNLLA